MQGKENKVKKAGRSFAPSEKPLRMITCKEDSGLIAA
jgi:hypothetical protein